jgi:cell division protein FtsB
VYRWIELGRLDTVERLGKKYVNASVPLKTAVNDNDNVGNDMKSKNAGALQSVNVFEEYLKTLRENSKRYEKSCRRWQMSCFASVFLFFMALLAGTAISLFYHYGYENLSDKLEASSTELAEVESGRTDALATVEDLNEDMELRLKPYKDENTRLRERIDELVARNDNLRDRLDVTFDRNAFLLQRFAEEAAISEVASVDPLETSDNTKN